MWSKERGGMGTPSHPQHCSHLILPTDMVQHRLGDFGESWCTLPLPLPLSSLTHLAPLPHLPQLPLATLQLQTSYTHPQHIFTDCKTGSIHLLSSVGSDGGERGQEEKNKSRGEKRPIPEEHKDEKYYERRKRNNQAAKKSRDARKFREDQIALRAMLLEQENRLLRAQLAALREEARSLLLH